MKEGSQYLALPDLALTRILWRCQWTIYGHCRVKKTATNVRGFVEGASFMVQALTTWHGLVEIGGMPTLRSLTKTELQQLERPLPYSVLVHSAAGCVGLWASEIAARRVAAVIGVVGSEEKAEIFLKRILQLSSTSITILRDDEKSYGERLKELFMALCGNQAGEDAIGVDLVMESLGGKYFKASYEALQRGGSLVTFGSTSDVSPGLGLNTLRFIWRFLNRPKVDPGGLTARIIRLAGINLIYLTDQPRQLRRELSESICCLGRGRYEGKRQARSSIGDTTNCGKGV